LSNSIDSIQLTMLHLILSFLFGLNTCLETTVSTPYYSSSVAYSLKELTTRGLPSISSVTPPGTTDYFANVDIPSREMMNLTHPYCFFKEAMETWCCGENRSECPLEPRANSRITPYTYCLITEVVC
jgi:hypothetical protein